MCIFMPKQYLETLRNKIVFVNSKVFLNLKPKLHLSLSKKHLFTFQISFISSD